VTILILMGLFGGRVGGSIDSLLDYCAPPVKRFWLFIIPEFIGFTCAGIMILMPLYLLPPLFIYSFFFISKKWL
jgi:hypothetical protein